MLRKHGSIRAAAMALGISRRSFSDRLKRAGVEHTWQGQVSPMGIPSARQLHELLMQQGCRCVLTGETLTPKTASVDHKMPLSRGGGHGLPNLQWLTTRANRAKGQLTNDEFIELCRAVVREADRKGRGGNTFHKG